MTRFSEWVSALSPSNYAELALLVFALVFVAVVIRMFRQTRTQHESWARLPLDSDGGNS